MPGRMMHMRKWTVSVFVVVAGVAVSSQSGEQRLTPAEVKWPAAAAGGAGTSGVSGIQTVVLKGDPTKAGLYTLLLRGPKRSVSRPRCAITSIGRQPSKNFSLSKSCTVADSAETTAS